jgi:hypothetical protein
MTLLEEKHGIGSVRCFSTISGLPQHIEAKAYVGGRCIEYFFCDLNENRKVIVIILLFVFASWQLVFVLYHIKRISMREGAIETHGTR